MPANITIESTLLTVLVNWFSSKKEYVEKAVESISDPEEIEKKYG